MNLKDRYPEIVTQLIAKPAKSDKLQPGLTFKTSHFGKTREFKLVQKFIDGTGRPCWHCETVKNHKDGHNSLMRTEDGILSLLARKKVAA